jgi:ubiquinone/menaquinone biosynthesis C-methylase UbiE
MSHRNSEDEKEDSSQAEVQQGAVQQHVNAHFDSTATYWDGVYRGDSLQGVIYQDRQAAVLDYVDAAALQSESRVLEIGCGAGHLTMELAERGLRVDAVDASPVMVDAAAGRAAERGLSQRVTVGVADVHALPFGSSEFDLVVAVGLIPWLHSPDSAVREMARVLRPGGQLVLTADNRARLVSFTDPRAMLALSPLKRVLVALRRRRGKATSRLDSPRTIDRLLLQSALRPLERRTVGFGPLSFMGWMFLGEARSIRVNGRLQALANRGTPGLRLTGWHYLVHAKKPSGP